ncbi:MAG: carboxypeptidase regulatory-like domain-containing protein [Planctomycetaceae bacterium]|nr:carboxypeptidase regulatory-like domain-containing protein [Planctomycetaceae bacterium]
MRACYVMLLGAVSLALSGCGGGDGVDMADVSGVVTYKGKPLADADVYFVSGNFEGYGRTDAEGRYSLVRGAPVGDCKVYITKDDPEMNSLKDGVDLEIEGMDEEQIRAMGGSGETSSKKKDSFLPPEFSDPQQTKLTFNVPSGGTEEANFKL